MGRGLLATIVTVVFCQLLSAQVDPVTPKKSEEKVYEFREEAESGNFKIYVDNARRRRLDLDRLSRFGVLHFDGGFAIEVRIGNTTKNVKCDYKTWRAFDGQDPDERAVLKDTAGSRYKINITPDDFAPVKSPPNEHSFYPRAYMTEQLYFELPVDGFTALELTLPLGNIGGKGSLKFRITPDDLKASIPKEPVPEPAVKPKKKPVK